MTLTQTCHLLDGSKAEVKARWEYHAGVPGTLCDERGWEIVEHWILNRPKATHGEREYVRQQLRPPALSQLPK